MDRNCDKCIHHTSGMCDSWECKMQTVEDLKKEAVKEYVEAVVSELEKVAFERFGNDGMGGQRVVSLDDAISIVRGKEQP